MPRQVCPTCGGSGKVMIPNEAKDATITKPCEDCNGEGTIAEKPATPAKRKGGKHERND